MEEIVLVLDQETDETMEMSRIAFESLVSYDDKGRYVELHKMHV